MHYKFSRSATSLFENGIFKARAWLIAMVLLIGVKLLAVTMVVLVAVAMSSAPLQKALASRECCFL